MTDRLPAHRDAFPPLDARSRGRLIPAAPITRPDPSARPAAAPIIPSIPDAASVLATAVYVTGNGRLEPGRRYSIAVFGRRLQILEATDIDTFTTIVDRPLEDVEANSIEGRLLLSEPRRKSGIVLAFMSVAGASTDDLVGMIAQAGGGSRQ